MTSKNRNLREQYNERGNEGILGKVKYKRGENLGSVGNRNLEKGNIYIYIRGIYITGRNIHFVRAV